MTKDDTPTAGDVALAKATDISAAIGLLTRLPIRLDTDQALRRGARSAWAWPLVGLIPAAVAAVFGFIALGCGVPAFWAAGLALAAQVMITGAMHEDGLADTVDGLWGGITRTHRLEIMKDSHIGAYGVIALVLSLLLRATALAAILPAEGAFWALLVTGVVSRAPMAALMAVMSNARDNGLSKSVGRVPANTAWLALAIAGLFGLILTPYAIFALLLWVGLAVLILAGIARQKIGGQTGDILGASQQVAEIAALAVFAVQLS
ncbi:adenosylcobinamide-GDP ribazoletransferase [Aliiroseovarius sp. S1339]|uniref:adenosylcobinamide-GDP ribazoletransferase n=1 Tax=Aliiroseovarius sp. S1339 TaxID=2936990 RepID=UPI0020BFC6F5|nr:adenosylcobinamide-GDP ribazoletransferase [Aliiroseovarius sp. S1339]MCK8463666.1 adenosylcobinamide-GDP ribazoletransferase [Aliiroseovarius sp. S1339]